MFEILTAYGNGFDPLYGSRSGNWEPLPDANEFATEADALTAIGELRRLGEDWATATYAVRRIGDRYPLWVASND